MHPTLLPPALVRRLARAHCFRPCVPGKIPAALFPALACLLAASLPAQTTLKEFIDSNAEGGNPVAPLAIRGDGVMFGATNSGGANNLGTLFRVNANGTGFNVLKHLDNASGYNPTGGLLLASDGRLYGAATWGGASGGGTLFRLDADGANFTVLRALNPGVDGQNPIAGLTEGPDGRLYGAAYFGGPTTWGTVFRLNADGTGFTVLHSFANDAGGGRPYGTPAFGPDGKIYGTTWTGGSANCQGVIYRMNADGTNFSVIFTFTGAATGEQPYAGVRVAADGRLYGTTNFGGAYGGGVVYRVNPDGSAFTVLRHLGSSNPAGSGPFYAVPLLAGGRLYVSAGFNGAGGAGSVFSLNPDGSRFAIEMGFSGTGKPLSGVSAGPDGLFGTTREGGPGALGSLFRLRSLPNLPFFNADFSAATMDPNFNINQWTAGNAQFLPGTQPYWSVTSGGGQMTIRLAPNNNDYLPDGPHVQTSQSFGVSGDFTATVTIDISANNGGGAGFFADFPAAYAGIGFANGSIGFNTSVPNSNASTPSALTKGVFMLTRSGTTLTAQFRAVGAPSFTILRSLDHPTLAGSLVFDLTNYAGTGRTSGLAAVFSDFYITVPAVVAPVLASGTASGTYNAAFNYQITATNSPTSYNATGLPAGLSVNASTGAITGTPTQTGAFTVNLTASNSAGTGTGTLALTIAKAAATVTLDSASLSQTYDGTAKTVTATTNPSGLAVTLNYLGDHTNAGSSSVQAIIDDPNYTGSATGTLVIAKANALVTVSGFTGPYDGTAHGATGTATGVGNVSLAGLNLGASFTNAPGGTAHWTFTGGTNYHDQSGDVPVVINKVNATIVVTPYSVEYDGQPHSATVASITGAAGETGAVVGTVALNTTHSAVGIYADSWSFTGGTNYHDASGTLTDSITDTTPPVIASVTPSLASIWPPNKKMVAVSLSVVAGDLAGVVSLRIISVSTNEPDGSVQWQLTGPLTLNLLADRLGHGSGRIYTITVEARDAAGNASTKSCTVTVPHDQGK